MSCILSKIINYAKQYFLVTICFKPSNSLSQSLSVKIFNAFDEINLMDKLLVGSNYLISDHFVLHLNHKLN